MMNFNRQLVFLLLLFFLQQIETQNPPVVPLTNALTSIYCHHSKDIGTMIIRCNPNEKIRMLDAFDVVVKNKSHLPLQCLKEHSLASISLNSTSRANCKIPTSFASACSGRENCTLHMQRMRLYSEVDECYDELVDYTMAFFECVSDAFIHDVCSTQAITSVWGTLQTPNFPNPYTANEDCWCKLSTQSQYRLLLSVIAFQLIPYDQQCAGAGLYLQSSDQQRSTQCTYLQQGHNYLSDTNALYINFYSRTSTVRGGFWIIYEANQPSAEVHLQCGSKEEIGIPLSVISNLSPIISTSYNHGWSRLTYNNPPNPTTTRMDYRRFWLTTPHSLIDHQNLNIDRITTPASAFTYPYGRLTTFELDYGPKGWFVKYLFGSSDITATRYLQTSTTQSPVVKWNSTWRYFRRPRPKVFLTRERTFSTTILTTETISTTVSTITSASTTVLTSTIPITFTSTPSRKRQLVTNIPSIYYSSSRIESSTTARTFNLFTTLSTSTKQSKTSVPPATPWYPPSGLFDWWQWRLYTTKVRQVPSEPSTTTTTTTETTSTTTTTTTTTTVTTVTTTTPTTTTTTIMTTKIMTTTMTTTNVVEPSTTPVVAKTRISNDLFSWVYFETTSTTVPTMNSIGQGQYDGEDDYNNWPDYFGTTQIEPKSTRQPLRFFSPKMTQRKFQQMNYYSTNLNPQYFSHLFTNPISFTTKTLPKSQSNVITAQNMIQKFIEQEHLKSSEDNGWLSKTDMTIVGVSILFILLLIFVNFILFAVRRHRHRVQSRHLLSASSVNSRRITPIDTLQYAQQGIQTNSFTNSTNNNNNDILPGVGEIVLWDGKDQGGYMIDKQGEWEKIEGHSWFRNNPLKSPNKASFTKSFRSHLQLIRQSNKKPSDQTSSQTFQYPLLMDSANLSPVPEVDDYRSSDMHSDKPKESVQNEDYYKTMEFIETDSNYTTVPNHPQCEGSVIISVPTMLREEDDIAMTTDGGESIYNQNYSIQANDRNETKAKTQHRTTSSSIIVGYCQANIQPLNPKYLLKYTEHSLLADHQQFSSYDSGFFDSLSLISGSDTDINLLK